MLHKLARSAEPGALVFAKALFSRGAEADYPNKQGKTALHVAAEYGRQAMCEWLLTEAGADPSMLTLEGWTPLHAAVFAPSPECTRALLRHPTGAKLINQRDLHYRTPLHVASYRADEDVLKLLCAHGAAQSGRASGVGGARASASAELAGERAAAHPVRCIQPAYTPHSQHATPLPCAPALRLHPRTPASSGLRMARTRASKTSATMTQPRWRREQAGAGHSSTSRRRWTGWTGSARSQWAAAALGMMMMRAATPQL